MKNKKRALAGVLAGLVLCALSACGEKAAPITLPEAEALCAVDVINGDSTVSHYDETWIGDFLEDVGGAEPTDIPSVQDAPVNTAYIQVDLRYAAGGTGTFFVYEDRGRYYVEQPYQGVYRISETLYERYFQQPR